MNEAIKPEEVMMPEGSAERSVCSEHSGLKVWVQIGCLLLTANLAIFSYSSFIQVPQMKENLKDLITVQAARVTQLEYKDKEFEALIGRIVSQRNADHPIGEVLR